MVNIYKIMCLTMLRNISFLILITKTFVFSDGVTGRVKCMVYFDKICVLIHVT
jgi:hypothetical protein